MTSSPEQDERFIRVLASARLKTPSEREAYLRTACEGDEDLQNAIAGELSSEKKMGSFMQHPVGLIPDESAQPGQTVTRAALFTRGLQVAQYRIESTLGEGGMSTVYLAFDTKLQRHVAVSFYRIILPTRKHGAAFSRKRRWPPR